MDDGLMVDRGERRSRISGSRSSSVRPLVQKVVAICDPWSVDLHFTVSDEKPQAARGNHRPLDPVAYAAYTPRGVRFHGNMPRNRSMGCIPISKQRVIAVLFIS
jgi:hypothetical protein